MSRKTARGRKDKVPPEDIEALAARAKEEREKRCGLALSKVLDDHNCQMVVEVQLGQQSVPLGAILSHDLPIYTRVISK